MYGKDKATWLLGGRGVANLINLPATQYGGSWGESGLTVPDPIPVYIYLMEGSLTHHTLPVVAVGPNYRHG